MSNLRIAAQQALEALETYATHRSLPGPCPVRDVEYALRVALAEPEQQPHQIRSDFEQRMIGVGASPTALSRLESGEYLSPSIQAAWDAEKKKYTAPLQRKPLTDEEIMNIGKKARAVEGSHILPVTFARAIEKAHGIGEKE